MDDNLCDAFHQFAAKFRAALGGNKQMRTAQNNNARRLHDPRLQVPGERREKSRPPQHIPEAERLHENLSVGRFVRLQGNLSTLDEIELVRGFSFPKQHTADFGLNYFRADGQKGEMLRLHPVENARLMMASFKVFKKDFWFRRIVVAH